VKGRHYNIIYIIEKTRWNWEQKMYIIIIIIIDRGEATEFFIPRRGPASERDPTTVHSGQQRPRRDGDGERTAAGRPVGVFAPCRRRCGSCPATRAVGRGGGSGQLIRPKTSAAAAAAVTCVRSTCMCVRARLRARHPARMCVRVCACVRCAVRDRGKRACEGGGNGRVIRVIYVRRYPPYDRIHIYTLYTLYIYIYTSVLIYNLRVYIYIYQTRVFPAPHHPVDRTVADDDGDGFFFLSTPPHTRRSRRPPYIVAYPPIVCAGGGVKYGTTERYR